MPDQKRTACAITMVRDDYELLQLWIDHHERVFEDRSNLYVVAHGNDPETRRIADGCSIIHAPFVAAADNFEQIRRKFLHQFYSSLTPYFHNVFVLDADELVAIDPARGLTMFEWLTQTKFQHRVVNALGFEPIFQEKMGEAPLDPTRSVLSQRRFGRVNSHFCKPVLLRAPNIRCTAHRAVADPVAIHTDLLLFHLKYFDPEVTQKTVLRRLDSADAFPGDKTLFGWRRPEGMHEYYGKNSDASEGYEPFDPKAFEFLSARIERGIARQNRIVQLLYGPFKIPERFETLF